MLIDVLRFNNNIVKGVCYGNLLLNDEPFLFTLEDKCILVNQEKINGQTAIPAGSYQLKLRLTASPMNVKYKKHFNDMHEGMLWLKDVPGFKYVYIHVGNYKKDTEGCILVGSKHDYKTNAVLHSRMAYVRLYRLIIKAFNDGERVHVTIRNTFKCNDLYK